MRSFALALSVALLSLSGVAHAAQTPAKVLKAMILAGTRVPVADSQAHNSTAWQIGKAKAAKPAVFRTISLKSNTGPMTGSKAHLLKTAQPAYPRLIMNVAYIEEQTLVGPKLYKVALQGN